MKKNRTGEASGSGNTDWARFGSLNDEEIRRGIDADPDIHPTDADFWKDAHVVKPNAKQAVTIHLDADLLEWLRKQKEYQSRINDVLRTDMEANLKKGN